MSTAGDRDQLNSAVYSRQQCECILSSARQYLSFTW